jgi:hypothetical protein
MNNSVIINLLLINTKNSIAKAMQLIACHPDLETGDLANVIKSFVLSRKDFSTDDVAKVIQAAASSAEYALMNKNNLNRLLIGLNEQVYLDFLNRNKPYNLENCTEKQKKMFKIFHLMYFYNGDSRLERSLKENKIWFQELFNENLSFEKQWKELITVFSSKKS